MQPLDLVIIFGYLIGIVLFGTWFGRKQKTTSAYFLGNRSVPWWAVAFSIVATETSTITFISVPGIAFARGGNFQFLLLVFGYLLGRIVISLLFIPSYFRGDLLTVYQLLDRRFGGKIKMLAASLFVVMRTSPTAFDSCSRPSFSLPSTPRSNRRQTSRRSRSRRSC